MANPQIFLFTKIKFTVSLKEKCHEKSAFLGLDTIENEAGLYYLDREGDIIGNRDLSILKGFPNGFVSPHMAFYTDQAVADMVGNAVKGLMGFCLTPNEKNPFEVY